MKIELSDKEAEFLIKVLINNYAEEDQDFGQDIGDSGTGALLIGKLVQADRKMQDVYSKVRKSRFADVGRIKDHLFMGNGWRSIVNRNKVIKRIVLATSVLGGMEQNGGMGSSFNEETDKQDRQTIKDIALDVLTALGLSANDIK